jgi:class 3 adenylate cyclase
MRSMADRQRGSQAPQEWDDVSGRSSKILRALKELDAAPRPGTEHQLAILFSDIVGSTRYFEQHGDAEGLRMVQRHHELLRPVIEAHAGRVVKTIGDGLMATFGSPRDAVEAARAMQSSLRTANEHLAKAERIRVRIGIHYGRVLVDASRDVFGDVVNVAARIQARAEADQILVGEPIARELTETFAFRSVGIFQLKGKTARLEVFELPWKPAEASPQRRWMLPVAMLVVAGVIVGAVVALVTISPERPPAATPPPAVPIPRPDTPPAPAPATPPQHERPHPHIETGPQGALTLITFPNAEVSLGHRKLGKTPLFNLNLPVGVHRLQLVGPDRHERVLSVALVRDQPVTLKLKLDDIPLAR